jgi:signal-transduction protein with cAMP-binding, CBS, and nucleotidyltransferase domain
VGHGAGSGASDEKARSGGIPVVTEPSDPLLEGIITDRDLCCGFVANAKNAHATQIWELMAPVPVTCEPEYTVEECVERMQENQVRRIPVADRRGRCVGIVAQADVALHAPAAHVAMMMKEISKPPKSDQNIDFEKDYFYCGQTHEQDEILLLNRRRELHKEVEAVR